MLKPIDKKIELHDMTDAERDELDNMTAKRALELVKFCLRDNPALRNIQIGKLVDGRGSNITLTLAEIINAGLEN
jgi:hypothetical protein